MNFDKFPKIENILNSYQKDYVPFGEYAVSVKMDGANAGIIKQDGTLHLHSRNTFLGVIASADQELTDWNTLKGFAGFVKDRFQWFIDNLDEGDHIFMEWLIPHTITYPNDMYRKVYVFNDKFSKVINPELGILLAPQLATFKVGASEDLYQDLLDHTSAYLAEIGDKHKTEGIVLRYLDGEALNDDLYFKMVFPEFKEDNRNKFSHKSFINNTEVVLSSYYPVRAYDKILEKVKALKEVDVLEKQHIPVVLGLAWHDYMTEFFVDALKDAHYPNINTKILKAEFNKRIRDVFLTEHDTGIRPVWFCDDQ